MFHKSLFMPLATKTINTITLTVITVMFSFSNQIILIPTNCIAINYIWLNKPNSF